MKTLTRRKILEFLKEDGVDATAVMIPQKSVCKFKFTSKNKNPFILCGVDALNLSLSAIKSENFTIKVLKKDGEFINFGDLIIEGVANTRDFLFVERTVLNLMQQLSGVSTKTFKMQKLLDGTKIKILDTRKTIPGLRSLQKYAVKCGGGQNHRFGLFDMIMIKENHIKAVNGIKNAIELVVKNNPKNLKIEVECENLNEVKEAVKHKIDVIMLDEMPKNEMQEAIKIIRKTPIKIEISGGVNLENIANFKDFDVDYISSGCLTHSVESVDISANVNIDL